MLLFFPIRNYMTPLLPAFAFTMWASVFFLAPINAKDLRKGPKQKLAPTRVHVSPRLDQYGDPLPNCAVARLGTLRWRSNGNLSVICFSPDGMHIASGEAGAVTLWDLKSGCVAWKWENKHQLFDHIAFSPNGKTLAAIAADISSLPDSGAFQSFTIWL